MRPATYEEKKRMRMQIEQMTCFLEAGYAGLIKNLRITWDYDWDERQRGLSSPYAAQIKTDHEKDWGKHAEIALDTPTYWGTMSGELYEKAFHWRERLTDRCDDDRRARNATAMDAAFGPEIKRC